MSSLAGSVRRLTIDNDARSIEVELVDGTIVGQSAAFPVEDPALRLPPDFRRVSYDVSEGTLTLVTQADETLVVEVYGGGDRLGRRAVVYLDQNKWVQLAQAVHSPRLVPGADLEAARVLFDRAEAGEVVLPMSSGHMIETGRVIGSRRRHLAPILVRLGRGWLMRDPVLVRRAELAALFSRRTGQEFAAPMVFTLDPSQLSASMRESRQPGAQDLPAELAVLSETLSAATAMFAVLVGDESTHSPEGRDAALAWAQGNQLAAEELRSNARARLLSRDVTRVRFLRDLGEDLPMAVGIGGLSGDEFAEWLVQHAEADLASAPYLGLMRDVMHLRMRNSQDKWEANDLIDMLFLPCAAAYADVVVAENKTVDYLRRAQRGRDGGARVCTSLRECVAALDGR